MRNPNRNYHGKQPNKPIPKRKSLPARSENGVNEYANNNDNENISNPHHSIIHSKYWPPALADIIAFAMLIVTGLLMWFTYGLYASAVKDSATADTSANAANKSAKIAQQTLDAIKGYNTESLAKQQSALDKNDQTNKGNFKRLDSSLSIQDKALKESHDQFIKQNRPYLQVDIDSMKVRKNGIIITYNLSNLTASPVKIISLNTWGNHQIKQPVFDKKNMSTEIVNNWYIMKENPQTHFFHMPFNLTDAELAAIRTKNSLVYFWEIVKFKNLVNDADRIYEFKIKLTFRGDRTAPYPEFIYNENYDPPKK